MMYKFSRLIVPVSALWAMFFLTGPVDAQDNAVAAKIGVDNGRATQIYGVQESYVVQVEISNPSDQPVKGVRINWEARSWSGVEFSKSELTSLPAHGTISVPLTYKPGKLGWFEVSVDVVLPDGKSLAKDKHAFSVCSPVKSKGDGFRYGVCSHAAWRSGKDYEREFALMDKLGIDIVRDAPMEWAATEPSRGVWRFELADKYVEDLSRIGVELVTLFGDNPKWATTGDVNHPNSTMWTRVVPQRDAVVEFAQTLAARYKDKVKYWEYCNEEDIGWNSPPEQYVDTLNAVFKAILSGNPGAICMNGGFAVVKRNPYPDFVPRAVPLIDRKNWSLFAYHDYNTFENMCTRYQNDIKPVYEKADLKIPIWINEGGFNMLLPGGGERKQAIELAKKYAAAPSLSISAYFWYDLRDDGVKPGNKEHHFGLVSHNFEPKQSFPVYQAVIKELSHLNYTGTLGNSGSNEWQAFIYQNRDGNARQQTMVTWRNGERKIPTWVKAEKGSEITGVDDIMGNPLELRPLNDGIVLGLGPEPIYLHASGSSLNAQIHTLLEVPNSLVFYPGKASNATFVINNPTKQDLSVSLDATVPELPEAKWDFENKRFAIKSGSRVEVKATMTLPVSSATIIPWDKAVKSVVALKVGEGGAVVESNIPSEIALSVPRQQTPATLPVDLSCASARSFNLSTSDYVYNLYSAELRKQTQWAGPDDLSVSAFFAYDDQYLHGTIVVKDDVYYQNNLDQNLCRGDSLQIALARIDDPASFTEIGFAMKSDGVTGAWVFACGKQSSLSLGSVPPNSIPNVVSRKGSLTTYRVAIPWNALGIKTAPSLGFRLNFYVNDNDNVGDRKQWLRLSGDSGGVRDPNSYRTFYCQ